MSTYGWFALVLAILLLIGTGVWWYKTGKLPPVLALITAILAVGAAILIGFQPPPVKEPKPKEPDPVPPPLPLPKPSTDYLGPLIGLDDTAKEAGETAAGGTDAEVGAAGANLFKPHP